MLDILFNPKTVALIGATDRPNSVGLGLAKNLLQGRNKRKVFFINPNSKKVLGQKTFASLSDVQEKIDLAIIAVPSSIVPQVAADCAKAKVGSVVVISAGFAETGKKGAFLQNKIAAILQKAKIPLLGPNCLGVINPARNFNGSFSPASPKQGPIALISQSGALIDSLIDKSLADNFGFSKIISLGNEAGISLADFLRFLQNDEKTKAIAVYVETIKNGREFIKIAREVSRVKPVIILKGGKTKEGGKAAKSHTAALTSDSKIYSAAFAKAGLAEVGTINDFITVSLALAVFPKCQNSVAIITNGGAAGVIAADWCSMLGVKLAEIPPAVFRAIADAKTTNPNFSRSNPLDIIGDAATESYETALSLVLAQKNVAAVIFIETLQSMTSPKENAKIILKYRRIFPKKPVLPLFLGGKITEEGVKILRGAGVPCFSDPRDAALAMAALVCC
ncbi:MAG: CoA-binding protein [Patescibacteria group bacterium]|nr:CoA-binding protein [Patescibacteria group bacterium]